MPLRYSSNNLILPGDRITFKSQGYTDKVFHGRVIRLYKLGDTDSRKWKVLVDDGLGLSPRVVKYERCRFYEV